MPRPVKHRKVCHFPQTTKFHPSGTSMQREPVIMAVDEYETIRLIDREGLSQEQCAVSMQIARTTVQRIYESARKKLADCIVEGRPLKIRGGDFRLCDGQITGCRHDGCFKRLYNRQYKKPRGENIMRIAVTYENGQIFQHFGHTEQFKIYDIQDGEVTAARIVDTNGSGHGALAGVLNAMNVDALICGGIGGGAREALAAAGIRLYGGASGDADRAVEALIAGSLEFNPDVQCTHHHHHDGDHDCGNHGCGNGHCG